MTELSFFCGRCRIEQHIIYRLMYCAVKIDFQDGRYGGHLGFPIGTSSAIFDLQVTLMLPTKFRVHWPRSVGGGGF